MHYDTPRCDTPFWKDVANGPRPARYLQLKDIFKLRTPRIAHLAPLSNGRCHDIWRFKLGNGGKRFGCDST